MRAVRYQAYRVSLAAESLIGWRDNLVWGNATGTGGTDGAPDDDDGGAISTDIVRYAAAMAPLSCCFIVHPLIRTFFRPVP